MPVEDLKAEDFDVAEDGDPQKVDTFEFVKIQTGGDPISRVEPRTVRESRRWSPIRGRACSSCFSTPTTSAGRRRSTSGVRSSTC
ncbi:MAG: hypothetical protein MZV64_15295 [Ignavibacteriales bacterium]|nr:hypothetical protein [Ignavibacteriales bacterium]